MIRLHGGVLAGIQRVVAAALFAFAFPAIACAQATEQPAPKPAPPPDVAQNCPGLVAADRPRVIPAAFDLAALNADQVRITFIGHATFLIESPQLVRIATDYNDYVRPPVAARHRHHEPRPRHPLHRPSRSGDQIRAARLGAERERAGDLGREISRRARAQRADQYPQLGGGTERYGNSIFIFEIANLCIAHLGHLHHTLTQRSSTRSAGSTW